jgi:hypothetical protein
MSGTEIGTSHMLFRLIINGLSATADGFGRESPDRIAARNNRNGIQRNSVSGKTEEYALRLRVAGVQAKLPGQNCSQKKPERHSLQFCFRGNRLRAGS